WAYGAVCWGEQQLSHLVLKQDDVPVAMTQVRILRVPVVGSGIAYVRWGPVWKSRITGWSAEIYRAITEAVVQEYVVRRGLMLRVVPNIFVQDAIAPDIAEIWGELDLAEDTSVRRYQTLRIDLRAPVEELRKQLSSPWRRHLRIAESNRLEIV